MNPFASRFVRPDNNVYRFAHDSVVDETCRDTFTKQLLQTLRVHRRAAIVGPHGTGKTTLLRSIEAKLRTEFNRVTVTSLTTERRHSYQEIISMIEQTDSPGYASQCLIVDGYEQLRVWQRIGLVLSIARQKSLALLITCHRKPKLIPTCFETVWDEAISRKLTAEKLINVPAEMRLQIWSTFENRLQSTNHDSLKNLRELWFAMYDEFEKIRPREKQPV